MGIMIEVSVRKTGDGRRERLGHHIQKLSSGDGRRETAEVGKCFYWN
jgi:hypothetical protein